ncbi:hypothetical protein SEA_NEDARYA_50 [Gordonia phage Nedarya]|nr:hypothetical protein SEA_NEDARYA_50 [Gordonia phage Nedarya]
MRIWFWTKVDQFLTEIFPYVNPYGWPRSTIPTDRNQIDHHH